jgi:hypothetical protein
MWIAHNAIGHARIAAAQVPAAGGATSGGGAAAWVPLPAPIFMTADTLVLLGGIHLVGDLLDGAPPVPQKAAAA